MAPEMQQGNQMQSFRHELQRGLEIYGPDVQPLQHTLQREGRPHARYHTHASLKKVIGFNLLKAICFHGVTTCPENKKNKNMF